ncbi:MAG: segregation and condensation protein A [Candidatus Geothermincolia bacterium]
MSFEVQIEVFQGPFDLLLQLIMKQELNIHEVPVAQITTSFLEYIEGDGELDLDTATEFMLIAATLLLIKARSLLPPDEDEFEAADESENAREFLIERLLEYKQYSNAADWLQDAYAEHGWYMPRLRELEDDYSSLYPDPFEGVSEREMARALMDLLVERATERVDTTFIAPIRISVAERIEDLRGRIEREGHARFSTLVTECATKLEVIATFLAILELFKRGEVLLAQKKIFGDIDIRKREADGNVA